MLTLRELEIYYIISACVQRVTKLKVMNHSGRTNLLNSLCHPSQCDMNICRCQMSLCRSLHSDKGENGKNCSSPDSLDMSRCQQQTCSNYNIVNEL